MANSGLVINNSKGEPTIRITDRIGRYAGKHIIDGLKVKSRFKHTFSHPELELYGELFYWISPNFFWSEDTYISITISGSNMHTDIFIPDMIGKEPFIIYYGVR
ncbi:hypothetical protein Ppb6_00682 [Photorhabdus australis subsp. thailandensis]|uniref:Uncharacterized protein n=1 Tax=Photorhabdus australis subsp. thailandensis TaxID=2805096 RepID=A0A1C0U867_9GAMM|nr:hypothetical protein [Photorhabdus australis]OCQ54132.1 hypothetical protein Ppb6_00682 [Photorhabdus australis subsp. thailandensis]